MLVKGIPIRTRYPFWEKESWIDILCCYDIYSALNIDMFYNGCKSTGWLIRNRTSDNPDHSTWSQATLHKSLGYLIYLQKYKVGISSIDLQKLIQWSVDNNMIAYYVLFTLPEFITYSMDGDQNPNTTIAMLDDAVSKGYTTIIKLVCWLNPDMFHSLFIKRRQSLRTAFSKGHMNILQFLIPKVCRIDHGSILYAASTHPDHDVLTFALTHTDVRDVIDIPVDAFLYAAEHDWLSHMKLMCECTIFSKRVKPSIKVYNTAFTKGHSDIVFYLEHQYKFRPTQSVLSEAIKNGHFTLIDKGDYTLTNDMVASACSSGSKRMIRMVVSRVGSITCDRHSFWHTVKRGRCDASALVFRLWYENKKPTSIGSKCLRTLYEKGMTPILEVIRDKNIDTWHEEALSLAAKGGHHITLKWIYMYHKIKLTEDLLVRAQIACSVMSCVSTNRELKCAQFINIMMEYVKRKNKTNGRKRRKKKNKKDMNRFEPIVMSDTED